MPDCASCGKQWPAEVTFCPDDGSALGVILSREEEPDDRPVVTYAPIDLERGTMVGEFRVEWKLGQGGMATVYAAIHPIIGKRAAIKVLANRFCNDATAVERFVQEARAVNQIRHPNIVDIFSFGALLDGRRYFVMEWLEGDTLGTRMFKRPLALQEILDVTDQICDAVQAAHDKQIVHRDLKPDNVFLTPRRSGEGDSVKLLDFGIAKLLGEGEEREWKTRENLLVGTPHYVSPEQARGRSVDHRTDIYSLGVMMYEMVLGQLPFDEETPLETVQKHLCAKPTAPRTILPALPALLDKMILKMLEKDPDHRPTIAEVRAWSQEIRATAKPGRITSIEAAAAIKARSRRWILWAGVGIGVAAICGAIAWTNREPAARPPALVAVSAPASAPKAAPAFVPPPVPVGVPAPAPERPQLPPASLRIRVVPRARIEVDGQVVGVAVSEATVPFAHAGEHTVRVSAPGCKPIVRSISVGAGAIVELPLKLERLARATKRPTAPSEQTGDYVLDPFEDSR